MSGFSNKDDDNINDIDTTDLYAKEREDYKNKRDKILKRIKDRKDEDLDNVNDDVFKEITFIASDTTIFRDEIKLETYKDYFIFFLARLRQDGILKNSTEITLFFSMLIGLLKIASTGKDVSIDIFNLIVGIIPFLQKNAIVITFTTSGIITLFSFFGYSLVNLKETLYSVFRGDPRDDDAIKESIKAILGKNFLLTMTEDVNISQMLIKYQAYIITCLEYLQSIEHPEFDFKAIFRNFITSSAFLLEDLYQFTKRLPKNIKELHDKMIENSIYLAAFDDNNSVVSDYKSIRSASSGSSTGSTGSESSESSQKTITSVVNKLLELKETKLTEETLITVNDSFIISSFEEDNSTISTKKSIESQIESPFGSQNMSSADDEAEEQRRLAAEAEAEEQRRLAAQGTIFDSKKRKAEDEAVKGGSKRKSKTSKKSSKRTKRAKKSTKRAKKSTKRSKKSNKRTKKH